MRTRASPKKKIAGKFSDAEIRSSDGNKKGSNYIEGTCGFTSKGHGETIGKLRVYRNGLFLISCQCSQECHLVMSMLRTALAWYGHRRTISGSPLGGVVKLPLSKTSLISHYKFATNEENEISSHYSHRRKFHHDELVRCAKCKKEQRFRLQNKEECSIYHDAEADRHWKCAAKPVDKISCEAEEECEIGKCFRGCARSMRCEGYGECVCLGCLECRHVDCCCRTCLDFIHIAEP